jgi:hypothetical protein
VGLNQARKLCASYLKRQFKLSQMTAKQSVAVDVGSRTLRTSIAPITLFSCSSVVGVGPPTQLNLGVNQDISKKL